MKTLFYDRTAYRLIETPVPKFFLDLDDHFDHVLIPSMPRNAVVHPALLLAESICARLADVEMFVWLMEDARKRHRMDKEGDIKAAILTRSFLLGYLAASRALLDSCAEALDGCHELEMARAERTFGSALFWQRLVEHAPNTHRRYHTMRIFFNEVFRWCAETTDRIVPLEMVRTTFGEYATRDTQMKVLDETEISLTNVALYRGTLNWIDPLQLHFRWKPQFMTLAERLCLEIRETWPIRE